MRRVGLAIMMIFYQMAAAQPSVKGVVLAEGEKVIGATVSILGEKKLSDSIGFFSFENLPEGLLTLQVSMAGYESFQQKLYLKDDEVKELTVHLKPDLRTLDDVVVTGTMKPVHRLQSPIAVEVYTPQFFNKNPTPSIFESLQSVNGVRPQVNCNVCNTGDIHINGLEGPYTMVTIDGMPIVSSLSSVYGLFGIPNQLIERVEIVKGPASGLYGSEAIGGLINIITKTPEKAPLFTANVMSTTWNEHLVDVGFKWRKGKSSSLLGINYFNYQNPVDNNNDNFTDVALQHRVSIFNKWSLRRSHDRIANIAARYFYEDRWGGEMQWNKKFRGTDEVYGESIYTRRWELIGKYQLPFHEKLFLSMSATSHHQNSFYGITPYSGNQKIIFNQITWDKSLNNQHDLLVGIAGRYNYYDDNTTVTKDTLNNENKPDKFFIPGLFVQEEWKLSQHHQLLAGLRMDYHSIHKTIFTPRVAYKWIIDKKNIFRLNAGTGFRVVNIFAEEHAALTGARAVEIKEQLKPEKSYNININYSTHFGNRSAKYNLDVSAWYTHFSNQIIPDYETDPNKIIYENLIGYSISRGASFNFEFNFFQRLKGLVGVTLQDVAKVESSDPGKTIFTRPLLTERWSGTWSLSYSIPIPGIDIDYTGNVYGPMKLPLISELDPRKPTSPVWSLQNIQVTKRFNQKFQMYAGIKNLLNWTPAKSADFLIARAHDPFDKKVSPYALTFDPTYVYAPNQGIRFFAGLKFNLKE